MRHDPPYSSRPPLWRRVAVALVVLTLCFIAWAGGSHFVYGSPINGVERYEKVSWSISETVINADELNGTPVRLLHERYPLFMQAAKRDGLLKK
jgi:hypothetical protein